MLLVTTHDGVTQQAATHPGRTETATALAVAAGLESGVSHLVTKPKHLVPASRSKQHLWVHVELTSRGGHGLESMNRLVAAKPNLYHCEGRAKQCLVHIFRQQSRPWTDLKVLAPTSAQASA